MGDIAHGATVNVFYLVEITRDNAAFLTTRDYTVTVTGDSTDNLADTIIGQLAVNEFTLQNRNSITSIAAK